MPGKQAKVVTPPMLKRMLRRVARSPFPARDRVMILLSVKAGLRACEIAGLDWSMVLDAQGRVSGTHQRPRRHREEARRPAHPDASRPAARPGAARARHGTGRAGDPLRIAARTSGRAASSIGSRRCSRNSASRAARRTPAGAASSPSPPATSIAPVAACATSSCSLGTGRSGRPSATSTATPARSGSWWRSCRPQRGISNAPAIAASRVQPMRRSRTLRSASKTPMERPAAHVHQVDARGEPVMIEFTLQATLIATIRVKAETRVEAERKLRAALEASDANLGMLDDEPIVVPVEIEGDLDLIETRKTPAEEPLGK